MERKKAFAAVVLVSLFCAAVAQAGLETTTAVVSVADTSARNATSTYGSDTFMYLFGSSAANYMGYVRFDLSGLNIDSIVSASLKMTTSGGAPRNDALNVGRFALHGLNNVDGNTSQSWDEATLNQSNTGLEVDWSIRTLDMTRVTNLDAADVAGMTETYVQIGNYWDPGNTITVTGDPLVSFLQSRVDDGGLVTFIINSEITNSRGYGLCSKENATEAYRPVLELTYIVPEPATMMLLGLGGLFFAHTKRK